MAEDTLNFAIHNKMLAPAACITDTVTLHGATTHAGTSNPYLREYGTDLDGIRSLIIEEPSLRSPIDASLPYCFAQVVYAIRYEMARSLEDVLSRRTRALLLDSQAALRAAPEVARILSRELRRSSAWAADQLRQFTQLVENDYSLCGSTSAVELPLIAAARQFSGQEPKTAL
jgi:glycerol-3-phosphate dehydrogenase